MLTLLDEFDFYSHLDIILSSLFTLDYSLKSCRIPLQVSQESERSSSSGSEPREVRVNVSTPGLIKATCIFLNNVIDFHPVGVCGKLHDTGLIKMIFRYFLEFFSH